ncbi:MAG: M67 family metallopeptidase [bacterium]
MMAPLEQDTAESSRVFGPPTVIEIHHSLIQRICRHAKACYPYECCGILIGRAHGSDGVKIVWDLISTENAEAGGGRDRYLIDGREFLGADKAADDQGLEIIGFYHSHPGYPCIPSERDHALAWHGYSYLIVSIGEEGKTEYRCWALDKDGKRLIEEGVRETCGDEGNLQ